MFLDVLPNFAADTLAQGEFALQVIAFAQPRLILMLKTLAFPVLPALVLITCRDRLATWLGLGVIARLSRFLAGVLVGFGALQLYASGYAANDLVMAVAFALLALLVWAQGSPPGRRADCI